MIFAAVPAKVIVPVPEPPTVTLPPELAASVPELAVKVRVNESPSESAAVIAERLTSLARSSVTVTLAGTPLSVGALLGDEALTMVKLSIWL